MYQSQPSDFETKFNSCILVSDNKIYQARGFRSAKIPGNADISVYEYDKKELVPGIYNISLTYCEVYPSDKVIRNVSMKNDIFIHPPLGFINHDFYLLRFIRPHQKVNGRYRLGFHKDSVYIDNMNSSEIDQFPSVISGASVLQKPNLFINSIYSLVFPKFYSYEEAMDMLLNNKSLGRAITPTIAVKLCSRTNGFILLKNEFTIGDYSPKLKKFILRTNIYNNELDSLGICYESI